MHLSMQELKIFLKAVLKSSAGINVKIHWDLIFLKGLYQDQGNIK